ncbi:cytochrome c oxidase assembly protein COX18, mitochondrial-like [Penaeus monodon]|uniref:cytochrome c oxidase assembly protein COX18, mitochondrial-like n=1 Tax=Penaeus monodon TaxID=6687 RepID=UPI0018A78B5E|nr:cytochrome c oxidase assembly protein COX18, mitochondrial-like [Penaeus monodon]XP_037799624.1 cytochrome c oxidase assembly protein COX18, mitochondrial-like [Penaeus monodon]
MGMFKSCNHFSIRPSMTYTLLRKSLLTKNSAGSLSDFVMSKEQMLQEGTGKNVLPLSQFAFRYNTPIDQRQRLQKNFQMVQSCFYHSLSSSRYRQENPISLLSSSNYLLGNSTDTRNFSMSWLDNLAITQAGWFRALAESRLVESLMGGLQGVHDSLNLPWWGAIIISTILMRGVLTFPLAVYQNYILAKVENLKPEMDKLVKELKRETAIAIRKLGWDEKHARIMFNRSAKKMWKDLIIKENCHPFKASLLLWVQIPLWVSMSVSFRNMASMMPHQDAAAQVLFLEISTGGFGWIPNLTEVDHSLILPVAMGLLNLAITEVNVLNRLQEGSKLQKFATNLFRFVSIIIIPIAATVPSCVILYWVTSSACGLAQNLALMHPGLRRMCRIPYTPSERKHPYQHLWAQMQKRLRRKSKEINGKKDGQIS